MKRISILVPLLLIVLVGLMAALKHEQASQEDVKDLGFPFRIVSEELRLPGAPIWVASITIPTAHYSRENLDRLFRFYSERHPDLRERILLRVATGSLDVAGEVRPNLEGDPTRWDAIFNRDLFGRDEWYSYKPNLDRPDQTGVEIIKGTLIHRPKRIVQTWKTSKAGIKLHVIAYYLDGVVPEGVYYTFQSPEIDSSDWRSIMTFRQDERIPIPSDSIIFVNNTTVYMTMGSMYAVTTDNGTTWSVWDSERDVEPSRWKDRCVISHVEIHPNGAGTMIISPRTRSAETSRLRTADFGRHWISE
jgi:hypothetical protein